MPFVSIKTSLKLTPEEVESWSTNLSRLVYEATGKPEAYIMISVEHSLHMRFGGNSTSPTVFVDFRSIGCISGTENKKTSSLLTKFFSDKKVPPARVYITFMNVDREDWGFQGSTFAR
ncbi:Macrophage migration inhibitory factor like protein [Aduncisulcus paluster]|uniref:L-dopachrome isomerase n=1 Tax=Aduncisulcus paluster TaxID=2918883 RepID=A0ABQ5K6B2_9EUKA|nr:Macrophage migration inhibitory factor like protein [Aduncisulcus paluster]